MTYTMYHIALIAHTAHISHICDDMWYVWYHIYVWIYVPHNVSQSAVQGVPMCQADVGTCTMFVFFPASLCRLQGLLAKKLFKKICFSTWGDPQTVPLSPR